MNELFAFCENKSCGVIFIVPSFIESSNPVNVTFKNTKFGPCPNCGSEGLIPDGIYNYFDQVISFVRGPKDSLEKLIKLKQLLQKFKTSPKSIEEVIHEVQKVSPNYAKTISDAPKMDYQKWIITILAILTAAILVQQTYFKGSDDEIKNKVIEQLLEQNKVLIEQRKTQPINILVKPGRNEKCPCGSGLKYKKCCLNK